MDLNCTHDKFYKEYPYRILAVLYYYSVVKREQLPDELFYIIIRIRKYLTEEMLASEEVRELIRNVFAGDRAYEFVKVLEEVELLELVFPNIYALIKIDGGHYHNETVYSHVLGALRALRNVDVPWFVKLAALYHDCGKQKYEDFEDGRRRFSNHATSGAFFVECDLRRFKFDEGTVNTLKTLVLYHMSHLNDGNEIHVKSLRKVKTVFEENNIPFKYFFWVRYADNMGSAKKKTNFMYYWGIYKRALQKLNPPREPSISDLKINGNNLIEDFGLTQGKVIGYVLKKLFNQWQASEIENVKEVLESKVRDLINEFNELHKQ